jgi:hypothetical protein
VEEVIAEVDRHQAVGQGECQQTHELDPRQPARRSVGHHDVDAYVRVLQIRRAEPEREQRRVQVPLELLQPRRAEPGNLEAELAGQHVEHDDHRADDEQPPRRHSDGVEQPFDRPARREQPVHAGRPAG